jgi:arylsulfatase A-like enzyme
MMSHPDSKPRAYHSGLRLTLFCILGICVPAIAEGRPNVILIVADDLRPELACYGVSGVVSPNIDRLAKRGMLFQCAYAQYPVCNPSRSSFLSGLRPDETGIVSNEVSFRDKLPDLISLPELFRRHGYFTAGIGKIFHLGEDAEGREVLFQDPKSWDHFFDSLRDAPKIGRQGEGRNLTDGRLKWCEWRAAAGTDNDQPDGINTTEALRVLDEHRGKPFFLALGIHKPHDPFIAPRKYFDLYPEDSMQLIKDPADRSPRVRHAIPNQKDFATFTDKERLEFKRAYLACVSFADAQVGRILDALDQHKLWENTIVILIGDHGYHLGEHNWWNKVTVYELGARSPMIAWIPGAKGMGRPTEALMEFVDLYPTLIDYAGIAPPHRLAGTSLRPVFEDPAHPGKEAAFTQVNRGPIGRSVRTKRWRYTEWGDNGRSGVELYDHEADAGEYHNLAEDPGHSSTRERLAGILARGFPPAK